MRRRGAEILGPVKLGMTVEAVDAWLALQELNRPPGEQFDYARFGVNIYSATSKSRCITSKIRDKFGEVHYWTIKGEGSSKGCREYAIPASEIVRAEGWIVV